MADPRLIWLLALGACNAAAADGGTSSGLRPPAGWRALPEVATAARTVTTAAAPGVTIAGVEAWGEPAMGCYAVWLALQSGNTETAQAVLEGLTAAAFTLSETRTTDTTVTTRLARGPYTGQLRVQLAGVVTALACVANDRERPACESACARFFEGGA